MILKKKLFLIVKPLLSQIDKFREKHTGETCYIFGNGISLKWFDLEVFKDKPAFSINFLMAHKSFKTLNVNYNLIVHPYFFYPLNKFKYFLNLQIINKLQIYYREYIKKNLNKFFFTNLSNYSFLFYPNIFFFFLEL